VELEGRQTALGTTGATPLMSDAIRWGDLLLLSGRAAVDPATGLLRAASFGEQLRIVLDDALGVLDAAGSDAAHVLRVECWLRDRGDFAEWNAAYASTFPPPRPARTTLVADFPIDGLLVELQLTAAVPA
jgi:2-iminobutanoate/2-iminopropanoate deaminase